MPNEPLTGARYPASGDATTLWTHFQNLASDLADNTVPYFATTAARDTAFAAWVAAGGVMRTGLLCAVGSAGHYEYVSGGWVPFRGIVASSSEAATIATVSTAEARMTGGQNVGVTLVTGRAYEAVQAGLLSAVTAGGSLLVNLRAALNATPTTTSPIAGTSLKFLESAGGGGQVHFDTGGQPFQVGTSGTWQIHSFGQVRSGASALHVDPDSRGIHSITVYDRGPAPAGLRTL